MIKIIRNRHLIALSAIVLSTNAFSSELSYDYVQGAYQSITDSS